MAKQQYVLHLSERELDVLIGAVAYAQQEGPRWWRVTQYVDKLYIRMRQMRRLLSA